jgi:hypothetical protein
MRFFIKKGNHKSKPKIWKPYFLKKEFVWKVRFSKECWYERKDVEFSGVNKLRGITFGIHAEDPFGKWKLTKWLVNSALLGWQPLFNDTEKKKINLYLYYDENGIETKNVFKTVDVEKDIRIRFIIKKNKVHLIINDEDTYYEMTPKTWLKFGYHLKPYFGGKSTAPTDMFIDID